jgi:acetyl esterase/lipase
MATARILVRICALAATCAVRTLAQQAPLPLPPIEQMYGMPLVYTVPGMDKVESHREVVYSTVSTAQGKVDLKMDVYVPPGARPNQNFPIVMLVSGGGIEGGKYDFRDAGVYISYGKILAASGFVAVSCSKRYARGVEGAQNGIEDINAAFDYVRSHAKEFHADPSRHAFWAFSAGGLALSAALRQKTPEQGVVLCFYCVTDVDTAGMSQEESNRARLRVSPLYNLQHRDDSYVPPIFVARAGLDSADLNRDLDEFIAIALKENLSIEVMNHPTGRHAFDILDDNKRSREIIARALAFLRNNLASQH